MEEPKIRLEVLIDIRPQKIVVFDPPITATPWHLKLILEKYYYVPRERFLLSVQPFGTNQWVELDNNELQATWAEIFTTYGGGTDRKLFLVTHSIPSIHELPRDRERLIYIIFEDHSDRPRMFVRIQSYSRETVAELKRKIMKETNGELDFITRRIEYNDTLADIHCTDLEDNRTLASYALKDGCSVTVKIKLGKDEMEVRIKVLPNLQEVTKNYKLLQKKSPLRLIMKRNQTLADLKERLRAVEPLIAYDDRVFFYQYSLELTDDVRLDALKSDLNTDELNLDLIVRRPLNEGVFQLLVMSVFGEKQIGVQQRTKGLEGHVRAEMEETAALKAQQPEEGFFSRAIKSVFGGGQKSSADPQNPQALLRDVPQPQDGSQAPQALTAEPRNEMELRQLILLQQMEKLQLQRQIEELQQQQLRLQMQQQSRARAATAPLPPVAKQPPQPHAGHDHHDHDGHDHSGHGHDHSHPPPQPHPQQPAATASKSGKPLPVIEPIDPRAVKANSSSSSSSSNKPRDDLPFGPADLPPGMDMATAEKIYREELRKRDERRAREQQQAQAPAKKLRSPHSPPYPPPGYLPPTNPAKPKADDWAAELANSLTALEEPRRGRRPTTRDERPAHGELWANRTAEAAGQEPKPAPQPQQPAQATATSPNTQSPQPVSPQHNSHPSVASTTAPKAPQGPRTSQDHPPTSSPSPQSQTALLVKTPKQSPAPLAPQFIRQGGAPAPRQVDPMVVQQMQMQMQLLQLQLQAMQQPGAVQFMDPRMMQQQLVMLQQQMAAYMQTGSLPGAPPSPKQQQQQPVPAPAKPSGSAALRAGSRSSIDPRVAAMLGQRGFDPASVEAMENALLSSAPRRPTVGAPAPAQNSRPVIGKPASLAVETESAAVANAEPVAQPVSKSPVAVQAPASVSVVETSTAPAPTTAAAAPPAAAAVEPSTASISSPIESAPVAVPLPAEPQRAQPQPAQPPPVDTEATETVAPTPVPAAQLASVTSAATTTLPAPPAALVQEPQPVSPTTVPTVAHTLSPSNNPVEASTPAAVVAVPAISPARMNGVHSVSDDVPLVAPTTLGTDYGFPGSSDSEEEEEDDDDEDDEEDDDEEDTKPSPQAKPAASPASVALPITEHIKGPTSPAKTTTAPKLVPVAVAGGEEARKTGTRHLSS